MSSSYGITLSAKIDTACSLSERAVHHENWFAVVAQGQPRAWRAKPRRGGSAGNRQSLDVDKVVDRKIASKVIGNAGLQLLGSPHRSLRSS
ncbi:hypothetical protein B2J96_07210 [Mycobacterium shigaense]|nr:hypothetical protein B2J96_07210 [Mycobacterium shigaense]